MTNSDVPSAGLYPSGVLLLAESAPVHLSRLIDRAKSQGQDLIVGQETLALKPWDGHITVYVLNLKGSDANAAVICPTSK